MALDHDEKGRGPEEGEGHEKVEGLEKVWHQQLKLLRMRMNRFSIGPCTTDLGYIPWYGKQRSFNWLHALTA